MLELSTPPQMIISLPVQTAECASRADGAPVVDIAVHLLVVGLNRAPSFRVLPPQTIASLPIHTMEWCERALGAPVLGIVLQVPELLVVDGGVNIAPSPRSAEGPEPPQTIIEVPVQTALAPARALGAPVVGSVVHVSVVGL